MEQQRSVAPSDGSARVHTIERRSLLRRITQSCMVKPACRQPPVLIDAADIFHISHDKHFGYTSYIMLMHVTTFNARSWNHILSWLPSVINLIGTARRFAEATDSSSMQPMTTRCGNKAEGGRVILLVTLQYLTDRSKIRPSVCGCCHQLTVFQDART